MGLPAELLTERLRNEIELCQRRLSQHHLEVHDPTLQERPVQLTLSLLRTPGPVWQGGQLGHRYVHRARISITEDYPYEKPIVRWLTPIFHPNIMPPDEGGYVCTKLLEVWDFRSTLLTFIEGLETLLANPNPTKPFGHRACVRAANWFRTHRYRPPMVLPESERKERRAGGRVR